MFVRGYLRASTQEQDARRAKADLEKFAADRGLKIATTYIEHESGAKLARPELFRLLEEAQPGDMLLVEQVDRLSRLTASDWERLKSEIALRKLRVVALDLPTSWMMATPNSDDFTSRMFEAVNGMMLDVLAAVARKDYEDRRRRQAQGQAVEPVVQVFAEGMLLDHVAQAAVRGADDRNVHRDGLGAAQRGDATLLQGAQQPGLQGQRHVADLVQEQGAAVGLHDAARGALAPRAREGAVFIAEEFGLDQRLGDGGAVHRHEGLPRAAGVVVHGARQQFLAGAGFAQDEQRNVAVQDVPDLLDQQIDLRVAGAQVGQAFVG